MAKGVKRKVVEGIADFAVNVLPEDLEARARRALGLEVPGKAAPPKPLALPAPPKQLALPAPGPGLPKFAAKPRGGQFWVDKDIVYGNNSPEAAARASARPLMRSSFTPGETGYKAEPTPASQWLERALTKYYKNEFGSPDDPLRALAERGLHYDPEMTPEKWQATVNSYLMEDPVEHILFPPNPKGGMPGAGSDLRGEAMVAMPWLAKLPVTDKVYGISGGGLDLNHFTDEFINALNDAEGAGLPMDLAVRPESLDRMTFPQAVERVGRINQFRVKEMERAALNNLDSPAVRTFKEYPENNPMGLRWTELAVPRFEGDQLPEGFEVRHLSSGDQNWWAAMDLRKPDELGREIEIDVLDTPEAARKAIADYYGRDPLQAALKYEGDTMGHCVGGYCDDVMAGRSRIFSLRDAKGEPHVTIETSPSRKQYFFRDVRAAVGDDQADDWLNEGLKLSEMVERAGLREGNLPEDIIQIKGKQNRAPKDDYLPFVQDFVKSGQWGNVGDLRNARLVKLPDGRYITQQQADEGIAAMTGTRIYSNEALQNLTPEEWATEARHFEGYAVGGRVSADRCFSRNPMSVKKARGGLAVKRSAECG
jgi:hypothetical protein